MEKPIDFWLRKGKAGGEPKPTETNAGKADVRRYNKNGYVNLTHCRKTRKREEKFT
jgi:hypothetical protein